MPSLTDACLHPKNIYSKKPIVLEDITDYKN